VVHAKEVARIVFFLQSDQPLVVRAVRFASDRLTFVSKIITVGAGDQEGPQSFARNDRRTDQYSRVNEMDLEYMPGDSDWKLVAKILPYNVTI
jgi:hypothetical protein